MIVLRSGSAGGGGGGAGAGVGAAGFCSTATLKEMSGEKLSSSSTLPVQIDFHDRFFRGIDGDRLIVLKTRRATGRRRCAVLRMILKEIVNLFAVAHSIGRSQRKYLSFHFRLKKKKPVEFT